MIRVFGDPLDESTTPAAPLRTISDIEEAVKTLYDFIYSHDSENEPKIECDIVSVDPELYSMCSETT